MKKRKIDDHAMPFKRCLSEDLFKVDGEEAQELTSEVNSYLKRFVAPVKNDEGKPCCFHCGEEVNGFKAAIGIGTAYEWGMIHGEARCGNCGWPARGMHYPKGKDGKELFSLRNFFLAYHPDEVTQK